MTIIWNWLVEHYQLRQVIAYSILVLMAGFYLKQLYTIGFDFNRQAYRFDWRYLGAVIILYALAMICSGLNWAIIMRRIARYPHFRKSIKIFYLTALTRNLPGIIPHFASRVYLHQEDGQGKGITLIVMVIELLLVILAGALIYLAAWFLTGAQAIVPIHYPLLIVAAGLIVIYPPVLNRLVRWIPGLVPDPIYLKNRSYFSVLSLLIIYGLLIIFGGFILFLTIRIVHPISSSHLLSVIGAWGFSLSVQVLVFWLPGSPRLRDGVLLLVLSNLTSPSLGLIITLIWRYIILLNDYLWGGIAVGILWIRQDELWLKIRDTFMLPGLFKFRGWKGIGSNKSK
jgi:hypothetical protein